MYGNQTPTEHDNSCISNLTTEQQTSKNANEAEQQSAGATGGAEEGQRDAVAVAGPNQEQAQGQGQGQAGGGEGAATATVSLRCAAKDLAANTNASRKLGPRSSNNNNNKDDDNDHVDNNADDVDEAGLDVISSLIGQFGRWQLLMTILLSLFQVPNTFHISSSVYQVSHTPPLHTPAKGSPNSYKTFKRAFKIGCQ